MTKLTKAQSQFLRLHTGEGMLGKFEAHKTCDFVGRVRDLGLIEIIDGQSMGWPWTWEGTRLTEAGRAAIGLRPTKRAEPTLKSGQEGKR